MRTNRVFDTEDLRTEDNWILHPWESLEEVGQQERTLIVRGEGIYVYDSDGRKLIDGPAGMWCVNIGHGREDMVEAVADQMSQLAYYGSWHMGNAPAAKLAGKLRQLTPGDLNHAFFTTGGSTAVESALRFALFFHDFLGRSEKKHIISREGAYHGSTYLSASCCGKEHDKRHFDLETDFIHLLPSPNPYRRPEGMSVDEFCDAKVSDLESKIVELGPERVAAFIAEPVLASGGVIVPPPGYHRKTLEVCRKYDVLYISDEVVTAFGRLGHFFASDAVFDFVPDIITVAKGITSAYIPMGAMIVSDRILSQVSGENGKGAGFFHGFTYSGHPVACAAALKNIEIIERDNILEHVREVGPYFQDRLAELKALPIVGDVRGRGLMACVECSVEPVGEASNLDDYELGLRIDAHCEQLGLIVRPMVNMCVISPPLIITKEEIDLLVERLREGIELTMKDLEREGLWNPGERAPDRTAAGQCSSFAEPPSGL